MIVMRFNNYTGWGEVLAYLMILDFFSLMFVEGMIGLTIVPDLFYVFDEMFALDLVWIQMLTTAALVVVLELAIKYAYDIAAEKNRREIKFETDVYDKQL